MGKKEKQKTAADQAAGTTKKGRQKKRATKAADRAQEAIDLVLDTTEALYTERGDRGKLWGSMIKQTLKRRRPGFNESYYGFNSFSDLLEEAESRQLLELERDERSGGYIVKAITRKSS